MHIPTKLVGMCGNPLYENLKQVAKRGWLRAVGRVGECEGVDLCSWLNQTA